MQTSRLMRCNISTCAAYVLNESIQVCYITAQWHIQPSIYGRPAWFLIDFYTTHSVHPQCSGKHLTKSPFLFYYNITTDWNYHNVIIFTLYSLINAPALNQHATPISPSSNIPHAASSHLCRRIILCFINFDSLFTKRGVFIWALGFQCSIVNCILRVLILMWLCG